MLNFDAHFSMPGQVLPELSEVVNKTGIFWGRQDRLQFLGAVIDGSSRDAGNTGYTDTLRPGLLMGKVTSGSDVNKYKQWDPTATDGTQIIAGILAHPIKMQYNSTDYDRLLGGWLCVAGGIRAKGLVVASLTEQGISGINEEWNIRRQMDRFFQFDDRPQGVTNGAQITKTADATLTEAETGSVILVAGSGAVNLTLPATAKRNLEYTIINTVNQNLTITAGTADTIIAYNDIAADTVALSTAGELIGGSFKVIGNGSKWIVIPMLWEGQTPTIAS